MPYKDPERQKAAQREAYERDRQAVYRRARRHLAEKRELLNKLKDAPCADCKVKYPPYVMEWDHISDDKVKSVSRMLREGSVYRLVREIEKCDLVCANCHRERTWNRLMEGGPPSPPRESPQGSLFE